MMNERFPISSQGDQGDNLWEIQSNLPELSDLPVDSLSVPDSLTGRSRRSGRPREAMFGESNPILPDLPDLPVIHHGSQVHREIREIRETIFGKSNPISPSSPISRWIHFRFPIRSQGDQGDQGDPGRQCWGTIILLDLPDLPVIHHGSQLVHRGDQGDQGAMVGKSISPSSHLPVIHSVPDSLTGRSGDRETQGGNVGESINSPDSPIPRSQLVHGRSGRPGRQWLGNPILPELSDLPVIHFGSRFAHRE